MKNITPIIASVILSLAVLGAIFLASSTYQAQHQRQLELQARQDCAQSYQMQYTDTETNTTIIQPIEDLYQQCLAEKDIQ